jgi:hypothetical protein
LAISAYATSGEYQPLPTPFSSYAFGFGVFKIGFMNDTAIIPLDYEHFGNRHRIGATLGYGFGSGYGSSNHSAYLNVPLVFDIASAGPVKFGLGGELQSFNHWGYDDYYGAHTLGPIFDVLLPIPYNRSFLKTTFGVGFGADIVDDGGYYYGYGESNSYFFVDVNIRTRMQIYFNDRIGFNVFFAAPLYIISGEESGYYGGYPHYVSDRVIATFGPCFSW